MPTWAILLLCWAAVAPLIYLLYRTMKRREREEKEREVREREAFEVATWARSGGKATAFASVPRRPYGSAQTDRVRSESDDYVGFLTAFPYAIDRAPDDAQPRSVDPVTGHGGTFDGGGASSSWDASPCSTESSSYSSSDSGSSSSSSDSGSCSSSSSD